MAADRRKQKSEKLKWPRITRYRTSIVFISCILLVLSVTAAAHGMMLRTEQKEQSAQISRLKKEKKQEQKKAEEIEKFKKYVQTDEYKEEVARDKLGMAKENELIFKAEE